MKQYKLVDNVLGWIAFLIAAFVYCSTIETDSQFWDCPEFISTGYKLEIGHPPGAPFFMLTANLFSQFASNASQVARMVNTMSALLSATTILFLFWTITHLTRKTHPERLGCPDDRKTHCHRMFWSCRCTDLCFPVTHSGLVPLRVRSMPILQRSPPSYLVDPEMEDHADEPHSDRWLVLITMYGTQHRRRLAESSSLQAMVYIKVFAYRIPERNKGFSIALAISFVLVAAVFMASSRYHYRRWLV